ncbi:uncharacterized protein ACOB8E_017690 [Sarcophilus harrisii]
MSFFFFKGGGCYGGVLKFHPPTGPLQKWLKLQGSPQGLAEPPAPVDKELPQILHNTQRPAPAPPPPRLPISALTLWSEGPAPPPESPRPSPNCSHIRRPASGPKPRVSAPAAARQEGGGGGRGGGRREAGPRGGAAGRGGAGRAAAPAGLEPPARFPGKGLPPHRRTLPAAETAHWLLPPRGGGTYRGRGCAFHRSRIPPLVEKGVIFPPLWTRNRSRGKRRTIWRTPLGAPPPRRRVSGAVHYPASPTQKPRLSPHCRVELSSRDSGSVPSLGLLLCWGRQLLPDLEKGRAAKCSIFPPSAGIHQALLTKENNKFLLMAHHFFLNYKFKNNYVLIIF